MKEETRGFLDTAVERFTMLWFIMALGLGGTSVAGFALLNYTFPRPEGLRGLVYRDALADHMARVGGGWSLIFDYVELHIGVFGVLHLAMLLFTYGLFFAWRSRYPRAWQQLVQDNSRNAVIIAPALAVGMTFNVFLVGGYFYSDLVRENMQALMPWALAAWTGILVYTLSLAIRIQKTHLEKGFDVLEMHFGWMLVPFALGMASVSGAGVAALGEDPVITRTAFLLSLLPFTMAAFLSAVKMFSVFRTQYRLGLPERIEFLPAFFIAIPVATLLAITVFRYGHFFDHQFGGHLPSAFYAGITAGAWAFELWYLALGLMLLGFYFKNHLFRLRYFHESQWGLICPMVAIAVLGSFVYKTLLPHPVILGTVLLFLVADIGIISWIAVRQYLVIRRSQRPAALRPAVSEAK